MKVTVCELPNDWTENPPIIESLKTHLKDNRTDLLLLPEMPFYSWLSARDTPDPDLWQKAVDAHDLWISHIEDFKVPVVAGTRPINNKGKCLNTGFIWTRETGARNVHEKVYLPDEEGFWEATWYSRGRGGFDLAQVNGIRIGFLICTELWFFQHAREYAEKGIHLLLCPRATPDASAKTWLAGGRSGAWVSGAFCLSSNFCGPNIPGMDFGGTAWITEPQGGTVMGRTSPSSPFVSVDIDIQEAIAAKKTYPRYVKPII